MMNFFKIVYIISLNLLGIEILLACWDVNIKMENELGCKYIGLDYRQLVRDYGEESVAETIQGIIETVFMIVCPVLNTVLGVFALFTWSDFRDRLYSKSLYKAVSKIEKALEVKKKVDAEIERQLSETLDKGVNGTNYIHSELYQKIPENFV